MQAKCVEFPGPVLGLSSHHTVSGGNGDSFRQLVAHILDQTSSNPNHCPIGYLGSGRLHVGTIRSDLHRTREREE